jgi:hypothetical protein
LTVLVTVINKNIEALALGEQLFVVLEKPFVEKHMGKIP